MIKTKIYFVRLTVVCAAMLFASIQVQATGVPVVDFQRVTFSSILKKVMLSQASIESSTLAESTMTTKNTAEMVANLEKTVKYIEVVSLAVSSAKSVHEVIKILEAIPKQVEKLRKIQKEIPRSFEAKEFLDFVSITAEATADVFRGVEKIIKTGRMKANDYERLVMIENILEEAKK